MADSICVHQTRRYSSSGTTAGNLHPHYEVKLRLSFPLAWGWSPGRTAASAPSDGHTWSCPRSALCYPWAVAAAQPLPVMYSQINGLLSPRGNTDIISCKGPTGSIPPLLLLLPMPRLSKNEWLPGSPELHAIIQQLGADLWSRHTNVK